ncbi:MAG: hypothetical protein QM775_37045 [Pirellulales bacterium]
MTTIGSTVGDAEILVHPALGYEMTREIDMGAELSRQGMALDPQVKAVREVHQNLVEVDAAIGHAFPVRRLVRQRMESSTQRFCLSCSRRGHRLDMDISFSSMNTSVRLAGFPIRMVANADPAKG